MNVQLPVMSQLMCLRKPTSMRFIAPWKTANDLNVGHLKKGIADTLCDIS